MQAIAVDWSGATHTARSRIWLAEAISPTELVRLECGRDREEICEHLRSLPPSDLIIGLDFAFSFPAWFVRSLGLKTANELWEHAADYGEAWLSRCEPPFWGRPGRRRPPERQPALRITDRAVPRTSGIAPKSIFQIGGAGAVGTGSIRGMSLLHAFHSAGASIWPFSVGTSPTLVEIYPRLLTGPVHKSNPAQRAELLARRYPNLAPEYARLARASEDAFDAAVSALVMMEHASDLLELPEEPDPALRLEGRIWHPGWRAEVS